MDFKRDRDTVFTRAEFEAIRDQAEAEGNELVAQMAISLLATEEFFEKEEDKAKRLMGAVRAWMGCSRPEPNTIAARIYDNLKEIVDGLEGKDIEPELVSMFMDKTGIDFKFRTHWASKLIAWSIAKTLKKPDGTYYNNCTYEMTDPSGEVWYVEVQRKSGKTTAQQRSEAEARVKELEAEAALMREAAGWCFDEGYLSGMHEDDCPQDDTCSCPAVAKARIFLNPPYATGSAHDVLKKNKETR